MFTIEHTWVCIEINNEDEIPRIQAVYGPFNKAEAVAFSKDYNGEYDGSPWHVIVRPMVRLKNEVGTAGPRS